MMALPSCVKVDLTGPEPTCKANTEAPRGVAIHDPLPSGPSDTYTWHLRVNLPALYLDDAAWHQQNELMAVKLAESAGCVVVGEARWDRQPDYRADGSLVLAYLVPIKS